MTRPPLDSTISDSDLRRSSVDCTSASVALNTGSRLLFLLQPAINAFRVSGEVSATVCCFSTRTPSTRVSSSDRAGRDVVIGSRKETGRFHRGRLLLSYRHAVIILVLILS